MLLFPFFGRGEFEGGNYALQSSYGPHEFSQLSTAAARLVEQEKIVGFPLVFAQSGLLEKGCVPEQSIGLIGLSGNGFETVVVEKVSVDPGPLAHTFKKGKGVVRLGKLHTMVFTEPLSFELKTRGLIQPICQHMRIQGTDKPHFMPRTGAFFPPKDQPTH